ncbi:MAG: VWA domain-containing protein [Rhodobacteraceae bacterium]|nr:VWA domain-containing protein [Paracoccaceae bacterium]
MFKNTFFAATLALFAPFSLPAQAQPSPDTIVVLDVSNSMWGQIGGVSKIEIAREVIANLVGDIDPNARFGLVAYGHREKASCQDIELVLPVGPLNAAAFSDAVNSLVPRGRTPLTDAVRHAAEVLNYQDTPSRIILVSDGLESCNADPCALAAELARGGVDFTAHVVGFDVAGIEDQSQLSCLADLTGGLYLTAESTEELTAALTTMMVDTSIAPPPFSVILHAPAEVETNTQFSATWTATARIGDQIHLISENGEIFASVEATNGTPAPFTAPAVVGQYAVIYIDGDSVELSRAPVTVVQKVSLSGPSIAVAGSAVQITWDGAGDGKDFITVVPVGARVGAYNDYAYVEEGAPVTLNTPDTVGTFEIRYVSANSTSILAMQPITLTEPTVSLGAADIANAGAEIEVQWVGPNNERDFITIVEIGAPGNAYNSFEYTTHGSPAAITAFDTPGTYEIRYVSGQSNIVLARRLITLEEVVATLSAVETATAGSTIDITWKGPNAERDFITIVALDAAEGAYNGYAYTKDGPVSQVQSPDMPGAYEIRYVSGQSNATLVRIPLTLTAAAVTLSAPDTANAGGSISVEWLGPNNTRDYITIVEVGAELGSYNSYAYTSAGSPAAITAFDTAGTFELRYVSGQSEATLATRIITLEAVETSLTAVETAISGASIAVTWKGPNAERDFITIVSPDAEEGAYKGYAYTRDGASLQVQSPDVPGVYEIRYVSGQSNATLARIPLTLTAATILMEAQGLVRSGMAFTVEWLGPDNARDYLSIAVIGSADSEYISYAYTRNGSPASFTAPAGGNYELRYVSGQSETVLARTPLAVAAN